jgi:hypothetical protein
MQLMAAKRIGVEGGIGDHPAVIPGPSLPMARLKINSARRPTLNCRVRLSPSGDVTE